MKKGQINTGKVIQEFGGVSALMQKINQQGFDISKGGIEKWRERNSIPSRYLIALALIAESENRKFEILKYLEA